MAGVDTRYFPVFLDLERRPCVVVGEGPTADKRIRQLLKYDADIVVFSPEPSDWLSQAEADGQLTVERRAYQNGDLAGVYLAVCATSDEGVRSAVHAEAEALGCLALIDGDPAASSFILPSITHRDPIQIAVSTAGAAPELAKMLRKRIESEISESWGPWVRLVSEVRSRALAVVEDEAERADILAQVTDPAVLERLEAGEEISADSFFEAATASDAASDRAETGSAEVTGE